MVSWSGENRLSLILHTNQAAIIFSVFYITYLLLLGICSLLIGAGDCHVKTPPTSHSLAALTFTLFIYLSFTYHLSRYSCYFQECSFLKQLSSCFSQVLLQALGYCSQSTYHCRDHSNFYFTNPPVLMPDSGICLSFLASFLLLLCLQALRI